MGRPKLLRPLCNVCKKECKKMQNKFCGFYCMGIARRNQLEIYCLHCKLKFNVDPNIVKRGQGKYCSKICSSKKVYTQAERHAMGINAKGRKNPKISGSKSHFWKGGITAEHKRIRTSMEYRQWRESVYKRDDYTCQNCNQRGGKLNADHVKPFALFPELRFSLSNGRTLCVGCHRKTDTYGWKSLHPKLSTDIIVNN